MDKDKIYKGLVIVALIIIVFSGLSRVLPRNSMTLAEYARQNGSQETAGSDTEDGTKENGDVPSDDNDLGSQEEDHEETVEDTPSPYRVDYKEGFYYEPLSEETMAVMTGTSYPQEGAGEITFEDLQFVHVMHYNFDGEISSGELICNKAIAQDLVEIFYELYVAEYHIERIALIDEYGGDDTASMEDNNTSCFNYRNIPAKSKLSRHALGLAIDVNPLYNPYITYNKDGTMNIAPEGGENYADRTAAFPYKIDEADLCYRLFMEHGFTWGGNWNSSKDYQHFEKKLME